MSTYRTATCSSAHADQEDEIRGIWKRKITLKSWGVVEPPGRVGEERESHFERAIGEFREGAGKPEKKIMDLIIEVEARGPGLPPSRMLDNLRGRKIQDSIAVSLFGWSKQIQYKSSPNRRQDQKNYSNTETRCFVQKIPFIIAILPFA